MDERKLEPIEVFSGEPIAVDARKRYMASRDYILREISGQSILICCADNPKLGNSMLTLNESFSFLWKCYQQPMLLTEVLEMAMAEYDVPETVLKRDIASFLFQGVQMGLLVEEINRPKMRNNT